MVKQTRSDFDEALLLRFVPMSALGPEHRKELCAHAQRITLAAGETLAADALGDDGIAYLVDGEVRLEGGGTPAETVRAGAPNARFALPGLDVEGRIARATCATTLIRVDRAKVSTLLIWAQTMASGDGPANTPRLEADIVSLLLASELFAHVPPSNIERVSELIDPIEVSAGDTVVRQGEDGDYYYVVDRGRCEVVRQDDDGGEPIRLVELGRGESFGEEALLTDSKRNASVRMLTDGVLLRLTREYFVELISNPLLREVGPERAEDLIATGARWIDVRLPAEFENDGLEGATNIPLGELRARAAELPADGSFVTYCNTGRRAQAGAFLLSQRGLHACCLRDGIARHRPKPRGAAVTEHTLGGLQEELARVDAELEQALERKAAADAARDVEAQHPERRRASQDAEQRLSSLTEAAREASERLEAAMLRKRELESRVRDAEAEAASLRRHAEAECERMRNEAKSRLEAEKQRLADQYRDAGAKLKKIEDARREAEQRFADERARIEHELEQARARMEAEAARVRATIEEARREAEGKAESIRRTHMSQEEQLRRETEAGLRRERLRLENDFAQSVAEQERARQELEMAETARVEAAEQAERLRAELAAESHQRQAAERERHEAETRRLREAREQAAKRLDEARRARDEAEARRKQYSETMESVTREGDSAREAKLRREIKSFEEVFANAVAAVDAAETAHRSAEWAQSRAEQTAQAARTREEELRLQLYEEMETWVAEEEQHSNAELERTAHYARELERIQAQKEEKRRADEAAVDTMFTDLQHALERGVEDGEPLESFARRRLMVEEKARLVQAARRQAAEQTEKARRAVDHTDEPPPRR